MSNQNVTNTTDPNLEIPETTLSKQEIEDRLIASRISMLLDAPFFGSLACRLKLVDATKWCPTAATDGRHFYYNRNFIAALSNENLIFLFGHEVLHCVYDHIGRRDERDPMVWNIANDYVVNSDLVESRIGRMITMVQICYDKKYAGMVSEEIYDDIYENIKENGGNVYTLDVHLDPHQSGDDEGDGSGQGEGDEGEPGENGPVVLSEADRQSIQNDFKSATIESARSAGASNVPMGVKRLLDQYLNPQLDWRELLAMQIQSVIKSDYTMKIPSRKGMDAGFYFPGMDRETTIDIAVGIDTSGSISDEMCRDFLSEIKGIMEQYTNFEIHMFAFDTQVHNPQVFTECDLNEFMDYEILGGGGTDFDCCFDYMKENGVEPKKFVMFTDGMPWNSWGDPHYCDTLFIIHGGRGNNIVAPFGTTVPYERKQTT